MGQYKYTVYVDDNFHYLDQSERYKLGEFDDRALAISACQKIVDEFLIANRPQSEDLYKTYVGFGEDPFIVTDDPECKFSAWEYAKERTKVLGKEE